MSQQAEEYKTPIYLVTGFLESGKTSLIKNMLEDEDFSAGERTLLIVCEEGEEEYDAKLLRKANTVLQEVESFEDLTPNPAEFPESAHPAGARDHRIQQHVGH